MNNNILQNVANGLKKMRIDNNITIQELSQKSKIATSTLCRYEAGTYDIKLCVLDKILNTCNVDLHYFFTVYVAKKQ